MRHGLSANTQDAYTTGRRQWLGFRRNTVPGRALLEPGEEATWALMCFVSHLSLRLRHGTIKGYLAAVRNFHVVQGAADPMLGCERLRLQLRGIRREQGDKRLFMKPVTPAMLRWAKAHLFKDLQRSQFQRTLWAALLAAFFGLLRNSEYTPKGATPFDPVRQVTGGDCLLVERPRARSFAVLFISRSKADVFGQGQTVTLGATGGPLCPYAALKAMKEGQPSGLPVGSPLFWTARGALQREDIVQAVKQMATGTGRNASEYSTHSLRRGGASALWAQGFSRAQIQVIGRWRSDCWKLYISTPVGSWAEAAARMATATVDGSDVVHRSDWGSSVA